MVASSDVCKRSLEVLSVNAACMYIGFNSKSPYEVIWAATDAILYMLPLSHKYVPLSHYLFGMMSGFEMDTIPKR